MPARRNGGSGRCRSLGSALPETALTISVGLLLLFAMVRIALVGYLQLSSDGAAYLAVHEYTLQQEFSSSIDPALITSAAFPTIPQADVITSASPAPPSVTSPNIVGLYNTFNQSARQGGISGVRPSQALAVVTPPPGSPLNIGGTTSINVSSTAIEPLMQTMNAHFNNSGNSLNSNTASNYFGPNSKENTPPFLVGFMFMAHCTELSAACRTDGNQTFYELGTAAFLDDQNWGNAVQDASQSTGVFCDVYWHQQYFAYLLAAWIPAVYPTYSSGSNWNLNNTTSSFNLMYLYWDLNLKTAYPTQTRTRPNYTYGGNVCTG
jgi:hypothetical protein